MQHLHSCNVSLHEDDFHRMEQEGKCNVRKKGGGQVKGIKREVEHFETEHRGLVSVQGLLHGPGQVC